MTSRRAFLGTMGAVIVGSKFARAGRAALGWAAGPVPAHDRSFAGPYGIQLYSLRHQLDKDVPGTLKYIREVGYTDVETAGFYKMSPGDFKKELGRAGLKCTGMHSGDDNRFRAKLDEIIAEAKVFKPDYVTCPWVQEQRREDAEGCKRVAAEFNAWGKKLQAAGYRFAFHNHDAEFKPLGNTTAMDILIQETDPSLVDFELDLFFAKRVGLDPADYLRKYPARFKLVHLKEIAKGIKLGEFTPTPDDACVPLGEGQIDWPKTLDAAADVGVKYYYLEDESETAREAIKKSFQFLKSVRF
jgi:sugar phosphate isomerase/epimerase